MLNGSSCVGLAVCSAPFPGLLSGVFLNIGCVSGKKVSPSLDVNQPSMCMLSVACLARSHSISAYVRPCGAVWVGLWTKLS
jgi:hypothetical protein